MAQHNFDKFLSAQEEYQSSNLTLNDGSRVAVIGGGPAGSFFSYFLLEMAGRAGLNIQVDVYEPRDFSQTGPAGCNMCGGIISETLVQNLAIDGINLPGNVIQRGIDSYILHTDAGSARIDTPLLEKRIGTVHRGIGPGGNNGNRWDSFDGHLQSLAISKGITLIRKPVSKVSWNDSRPQLQTRGSQPQDYDLLAVSVGVNTAALRLFKDLNLEYQPPQTVKTFIREYYLGQETIERLLGNSMHIFLLDIPRLDFAGLIPKGDYVSLCLLGEAIDSELVKTFLETPIVQKCFPPDFPLEHGVCQCLPRINVEGAVQPFGDRIVFIGDSGTTRLYKDGIGAAYRTAKAAATTAIFQGVSAEAFREHYWPACRRINADNKIGKLIFSFTRQIQKHRLARRALLRMVNHEQNIATSSKRMSTILWDTFTGSTSYRQISWRALHPAFLGHFFWGVFASALDIPHNSGALPGPSTPTSAKIFKETQFTSITRNI